MQRGRQPARTPSALTRYSVAVGAVAVALALKLLVTPPDLVESPFVLFFAAVTVSAWYGGLGPGLVATGLATLGSSIFFLPPVGAVAVETESNKLRLALFLLEGGVISGVSGALHQARRQVEEALTLRDRFLHVAAHELKNPLATLMGYTQLLRRRASQGELDEHSQRDIRTLSRQAERLNQLIDSLLDLSLIERGRLAIVRQPLNLEALVRNLAEELQPTLERHTLTVISPATPVRVAGDSLRLVQVLQNLLQNAVKYSPRGGEITMRVQATGSLATVTVRDSGIGIPETALPRLFERYYRADRAVPEGVRGLGLGLTVVKEIVELHGGSVSVASVEGRGSSFTVSLPLAADPMPEPEITIAA